MKKKIIIALLFVSLICMQLTSYSVYAITNKPLQHSKEELYQDIFCTLLMPYIQKSVGDYYSKFLTDIPGVDPWAIDILSVERPNGYRTFVFVIKMEVTPYVGPHLGVGVDRITITVDGIDEVKVTKFEHIKSYYLELPPNYQDIIKKNITTN
ncbi:DUF3888 domain-containing protein [Clostridium estertheticum]|uniref:DUF3888 domain-containing protein n=1 Tax=Clostridium estertheticum TaxID=238834 RepID=UPI001C0E13D7|nr:DUF3888 domain-containing protein [Clostridium estertheticum]MBU3171480.1 DUF3888 domain-containing protein [Clostridium estertheticum]